MTVTWRVPNPQELYQPIRIALGALSKYLDQREALWNRPFIAPTLLNGWTYYGAPWETVGYRFFGPTDRWVQIKGLVAGGTDGAVIFNLPAAYRPVHNILRASTGGNQSSRLNIAVNGDITKEPGFGASVAWFALDCIYSIDD